MSITSLSFLIFVVFTLLIYYLLPKKLQWIVLLAASGVFYLAGGLKTSFYIIITSLTVYGATYLMQRISDNQKKYLKQNKETLSKDERKAYKNKCQSRRKAIMICTVIFNFAILCVFKYCHFAVDQINGILSLFNANQIDNTFNIIIPLGISFYTFQSVGYLVDVYWEYFRAEKNYFKVLLFVSFFPQITQGPISEYQQLSDELFSEHKFTYRNFTYGVQRFVWGFAKKMLVADALNPVVKDTFANYPNYSGLSTLLGALMYSVQIYADFSGYMDIMCGLCEMLGIRLTENFERPYFSKSIAEYWRRWHITLGVWFKKYVYYPIGTAKKIRKLSKNASDKISVGFGKNLSATIALIVTWLATGLWHGASWSYIAWGLVNGVFIIVSLWLEPVYKKCKKALRINESKFSWRAFQTLRTFALVTVIKVLPEVGTLSQGVGLWKHTLLNIFSPVTFATLIPYLNGVEKGTSIRFLLAVLGTVIIFVSSLLQRKKPIRDYFNKIPMPIRAIIIAGVVILIASFGVQSTWGEGGFMYANF